MNQEIYCSVDNCHYWGTGNHCIANKILVTVDAYADRMPDTMDAPQASTAPQTPANSCMETCCKTFVHKGRPETRIDGVTKQG